MKGSTKLLGQITQKFVNEYGPEEQVLKVRHVLVNDLHILSMFNGSFSMSKQGSKSALTPNELKKKDIEDANTNTKTFMKENRSISKNKFASVYLKHMVSEIYLLFAANNIIAETRLKS